MKTRADILQEGSSQRELNLICEYMYLYRYPSTPVRRITVMASDNRDQRAGFSNFGNCADIFAPVRTKIKLYVVYSCVTCVPYVRFLHVYQY